MRPKLDWLDKALDKQMSVVEIKQHFAEQSYAERCKLLDTLNGDYERPEADADRRRPFVNALFAVQHRLNRVIYSGV